MSIACPFLIGDHFPSLCLAVDIYCERCSANLDAEPVNAFANGAFLIGAVAAGRLKSRRPKTRVDGLIWALIVAMAVVGLGSFLFHTVATVWAEWADVIPILVFILLYLWLALRHLLGWPIFLTLIALLTFLAATLYLEAGVPSPFLLGGAIYPPTLFAIILVHGRFVPPPPT